MAPKISVGDVVLTSVLPSTSPVPVGKVITFITDERTVLHRIVALTESNSIVTAGDANAQDDPWSLTRADITGQARLLVPAIGLPGLWAHRGDFVPLVLWSAVTLAAVVVAARDFVRTRARHPRHGADGTPPVTPTPPPPSPAKAATTNAAATGSAVAAVVLAAMLVLATSVVPMARADAAFTGSTHGSGSWKAKSYSAITVGAMAGFGAIAATSVQDTTTNFFLPSTINGSVATTPGTSITGFNGWETGATHRNNQAAKNAMAAAVASRTALLQRPLTRTLPPALGGTLLGGVYASSTGAFSVSGTLTLDAKGDASARFVFRTTTTLTMADRARIVLANGARAENVWWIIGTTATLGTRTSGFSETTAVGNYLVTGNLALRGVNLAGRAVSFGGSVTLNGEITPTN